MVLGSNQIWGLFLSSFLVFVSRVTLASYHSLKTEVRLTTDSTLTVRVERVHHLGLPCCSRPQSLLILCLRLIPELARAFFQPSFLQPLVRFLSVSHVFCLLAVHAMQTPVFPGRFFFLLLFFLEFLLPETFTRHMVSSGHLPNIPHICCFIQF